MSDTLHLLLDGEGCGAWCGAGHCPEWVATSDISVVTCPACLDVAKEFGDACARRRRTLARRMGEKWRR